MNFNIWMFIFTLVALAVQAYAGWLCWKRIIFTGHYSKKWSVAWIIFFTTMCITFVRRVLVLGDIAGLWDGHLRTFLEWSDHVVIPLMNSIGWCLFLVILTKWWKVFFVGQESMFKEREAALAKKQSELEERERAIYIHPDRIEVFEPNGVEVEEPKTVVVSLDEKKVMVERPKRVRVEKPVSISIITDEKEINIKDIIKKGLDVEKKE